MFGFRASHLKVYFKSGKIVFIRTSPKFRIRLSPQGAHFFFLLRFVSSDYLFSRFSVSFRLVLVLGQDGTVLYGSSGMSGTKFKNSPRENGHNSLS